MNATAQSHSSLAPAKWEHRVYDRARKRLATSDIHDFARARAEVFAQKGSISDRMFSNQVAELSLRSSLEAQRRLRRPRWLIPGIVISLAMSASAALATIGTLLIF